MFRHAAVFLPLVGASLRLRGYKKTQGWLQNKLDRRKITPLPLEEIASRLETTCRIIRAAEHYSLLPSSCLDRSLMLWYLLQKHGIAADLRIGVRKSDEKFEAHAWVEHDGVALNQSDGLHRHYAPFRSEFTKAPTERP
jgi:hypothetical protein